MSNSIFWRDGENMLTIFWRHDYHIGYLEDLLAEQIYWRRYLGLYGL